MGTSFDPAESTLEPEWSGRLPHNDSIIIIEVVWLGNCGGSLLLKEVNRNTDAGRTALFDLSDTSLLDVRTGSLMRTLGKDGEEADDALEENMLSCSYINYMRLSISTSLIHPTL